MRANEYMKHMMKTIMSHKHKEGIKRELQDCIDDLMEAYIEAGMTPQEAEEEAIKQMGNPFETAELFNEVYQPRFEWKAAFYMLLWIGIASAVKWGWIAGFGMETYTILGYTVAGIMCLLFATGISYMEKSGDLPFLWIKNQPTNQHWAMPGIGVFANASSIAGIGIGFLAASVSQVIILYGIVTVLMLLQRFYIEKEQIKMEQYFLYKEAIALKKFNFEGPAEIENRKHRVRIRLGEVAEKGDKLVITGMKGFTFIVEKF